LTSRRTLLSAGVVSGTSFVLSGAGKRPVDRRWTAPTPPLRADPFTLGVASGDPAHDGFVIWTRLAPKPIAPDGLGGMPDKHYLVEWEVANDEHFRLRVRRGGVHTGPDTAHSVHVELFGLQPDRDYYYRFRVRGWTSRTGRARTAPDPAAVGGVLNMSMVSCASYPAGFFTAYRHLGDERPDVVLALGDYIYEGGKSPSAIDRSHVGPECVTLANYRQRYAQYKRDLDLQHAHAAAPWIAVWDDHEVDANYADATPMFRKDQPGFVARRAAAYQAYYENMPLRPSALPDGPRARPATTTTRSARKLPTRRARSPGRSRRTG
jgi:alkaline phosphatase D